MGRKNKQEEKSRKGRNRRESEERGTHLVQEVRQVTATQTKAMRIRNIEGKKSKKP